jgi:hypothetical protein
MFKLNTVKFILATLAISLTLPATSLAFAPCGIFKDVDASDKNCEAIKYVYERNIFQGYNVTKYNDGSAEFKPGKAIIRAEVLKVVLEAFAVDPILPNKDLRGDLFAFTDLKGWENQWWFVYLQAATKQKVVEGYKDGTFKPLNNITRAEFLKIFLAASPYGSKIANVEINGYDGLWADTDPTAWYAKYMKFANQKGLFASFSYCQSGSICPAKDITRADVAQMMFNYHRYLNADIGHATVR